MKMIKTGLCVGAVMAAMLVRGTSGTSEVNPSDITFETLITQQYVQHAFTEEVEINGEIQTERRIEHLTPSIRRQLYPDGRIDVIDMSKEDLQQMTLHPDKKVVELKSLKLY